MSSITETLPPELLVNPVTGEAVLRTVTTSVVGNWLTLLQQEALKTPILLPPILDDTWVALNQSALVFVKRIPEINFCFAGTINSEGTLIGPVFRDTPTTLPLRDLRWAPPTDLALLVVGVHATSEDWMFYLLGLDLRKGGNLYLLPIPNQYDDGHICVGSGNGAVLTPIQKTEGWITTLNRFLEQLKTTPWIADALFPAWKRDAAPQLFFWENKEGYPQVPVENIEILLRKQLLKPVSIATINSIIQQIHQQLVILPPIATPASEPAPQSGAAPEIEIDEDEDDE